MSEYIIRGGRRIEGEFTPGGAKNAALPILAASIMTDDENVFYRCPQISDVEVMKEIITALGCDVREENEALVVDSRGITCCEVPDNLMSKMRSSVFLAGPLLARCGKALISKPGGCCIGRRPIDLHIKAFAEMGASVEFTGAGVMLTSGKLRGADIVLDYPSVGATENIMMAATGAVGTTVIHNAAREPEVADLQRYLVSCGAVIRGAGTSKIVIEGSSCLHGAEHKIITDRIEAGTYLMAAACTGGKLTLKDVDPSWLKNCCRILRFTGCDIRKSGSEIELSAPERLYSAGKIRTNPYPGFPTDMQPQLTAIMSRAIGESHVEETVFENRYGFIKELLKMGADIEIFRGIAIIKGNEKLRGTRVRAEDLRGGAAIVLAALMAEGDTVVEGVEYIERGYSSFHRQLRRLGADIDRCI
jgi:UDP-N-acetylglucosamine 1-carboxyvinyltransferase